MDYKLLGISDMQLNKMKEIANVAQACSSSVTLEDFISIISKSFKRDIKYLNKLKNLGKLMQKNRRIYE